MSRTLRITSGPSAPVSFLSLPASGLPFQEALLAESRCVCACVLVIALVEVCAHMPQMCRPYRAVHDCAIQVTNAVLQIGQALACVLADSCFRRRSGRYLEIINLQQGEDGPPKGVVPPSLC